MITIDMKATGELIRRKCEEANLSVKEMCDKLNVSATAPYIWINGKGTPKLETLINLGKVLGCRVDELLVCLDEDGNVVEFTPDEEIEIYVEDRVDE